MYENERVSAREDYQELIDEVSALLGTPATLEGRDFALIAFGAHDSDDDTRAMDPVRTRSILRRRSTPAVRAWFESFGITRAAGPVRIPAEPSAGVLTGRICLPVRHAGVVYGYIWLLDHGALDLDAPRLAAAGRVADRIGGLLAGQAQAGALRGKLLRALLTAAPAAVPAAAAELADAVRREPSEPLALAALTPADEQPPAPSAAGAPGPAAVCALSLDGRPVLAVLVRLHPDGGLDQAAAVAARLAARRPDVLAGLSAAVPEFDALPGAWRQASAAARAARAEPRLRPVARWDALGPYRLLTDLAGRAPDPAVAALLRPAHRELARTAECYLDHAGQAGRTAAALGIHRQTLYYRLARVARLTGLDLAEGSDRLLLHMALKAARLTPPG
jgi:hypothetical protein